MVNTTSNEFPGTSEPQAISGNDKEIVKLYQKGENFYSIANKVFGFNGEEAIERVRQVLADENLLDESHRPPETRIVEE